MTIRLFEYENGVLKPTEHCYTIKWLKAIIDKYPDNPINALAYVFYMTCPNVENPYFNTPEDTKEDKILDDIDVDFDTEEEVIIEALERAHKMYETPSVRAYNGIKQALDNIAKYMSTTPITDGKEGNIAQIRALAKDFDSIRQSFKGISKDLATEQDRHVRGGKRLGYDQG